MALSPQTDDRLLYVEVGHQIRRARKAQKMTQAALALHIGLTRNSVTNIESGDQKFMVHTLIDIARALHVSPASLLPEDYETPEAEIDDLLKDKPGAVQDWIKSAVASAERKE